MIDIAIDNKVKALISLYPKVRLLHVQLLIRRQRARHYQQA